MIAPALRRLKSWRLLHIGRVDPLESERTLQHGGAVPALPPESRQPTPGTANKEHNKNMNWYLEVLKKYAVFNGRARRAEYWWFFLFSVIISIVLSVIDGFITGPQGIGILGLIYSLAVLIPSIAVGIRRLHDTGRSGWWLLISFVPLIGAIVLIVFFVLDSQPGENQYGPNPKGL